MFPFPQFQLAKSSLDPSRNGHLLMLGIIGDEHRGSIQAGCGMGLIEPILMG
jgi:hypothetical protein